MDFLKRASAFAPAPVIQTSRKSQLAPMSFVDKVTVPVLPKSSTDSTRLNFAMYMMMVGTSKEGTDNEWKTYIAAYVCIMTPSFADQLPAGSFNRVELSTSQILSLNTHMQALKDAIDADDEPRADAASVQIHSSVLIPGVPKIDSKADLIKSSGEWANKTILCHYSLILFMAGKRIDGEDHTQITTARPLALRGKAHIEEQLEFLEGDLRLSDESHVKINNAWAELSQLRALVFTAYAYYSASDTDMAQDLIYTTMHLLKNSNMAHAKITYDFLRAYTWAVEVPALRTSIGIYIDSVRAAEKMDPQLFPYVKLIYGDKANIFPRKELEPLVACAATVNQETQSSLADFYRSNAFNPIVEAFMEERTRRENIRDRTLRKQEAELLDYEEVADTTPGEDTPATE